MTTPYLALVLLTSIIVVARATRLVTIDQITAPVRRRIKDWRGADSQITYLAFCPWCMSIWIGAIVGAILWWATPVGPGLEGEGIDWWIGVPFYVLVSSWFTGILRGLED